MTQHRRFSPLYVGLAFYVMCILAFSVLMYRESASKITQDIDRHIYNAAVSLPLVISEPSLTRLTQGSLPDAEYLSAVRKLSHFSQVWNISHVFHLQERGGTLYTTVTSVSAEELAAGSIPPSGTEYRLLTPRMLETLRSGQPVYEILRRQKDEFRTVFVPLSREGSDVTYLAADKPVREIRSLLRAEALKFTGYALLFLIFAAPLVYLTYGSLRSVLRELRQNCLNLARLSDQYKELSYMDALTGLPNRRAFFENAHRAVAYALRTGRPLHALALDIDHFKNVNDSFGHTAGDKVLVGFAELLREKLRRGDVMGRCGGEEFGVLLPESNLEGSLLIAERLRIACAEYPFQVNPQSIIHVTVSIGLAPLDTSGGPGQSVEDVLHKALRQADAALYRAKSMGRNQVCVFDPKDFPEGGDKLPGEDQGISGGE